MHVLRGNHENEQLNERARSFGGGFAEECLAKYGPRGSVDGSSENFLEIHRDGEKKNPRFPFGQKSFGVYMCSSFGRLAKLDSNNLKSPAVAGIYERFQQLFLLLPLFAVIEQQIFVVHGGLFRTPEVRKTFLKRHQSTTIGP